MVLYWYCEEKFSFGHSWEFVCFTARSVKDGRVGERDFNLKSWWAVIDYVFKPTRLLTGMRERTSSCRPCASFLCVENSPLLQLGEIHCLKDHWVTSHTLFKTRSPENTAYWLNTHTAVLFDVSAAIARNKLSTQIHVKSYRRNFEGKCRAHSDFLKFFPQICKAHAACEHLRLYAIVVSKIIRHPSRL